MKVTAHLVSFCYRMYRLDGVRGITCSNINNSLQSFDPVRNIRNILEEFVEFCLKMFNFV